MWYERIYSFLFPSRCVSCRTEGPLLCALCKDTLTKTPMQITSATWALFPYHHTVGERFIRAMKFEGKSRLAEIGGTILAPALLKILKERSANGIIIPIPTSKNEREKRGYDHVFLMAESLARHSGVEMSPALMKIRETERQVTMRTREKRLKNLEDAFLFDARYGLTGKTIVLLDDVTTTGATFAEATRALKNCGAQRIAYLALGH